METKRRQTDYDALPDVVGLSLGLLGLSLPRCHGLALLVHLLVGVVQLQKKSEKSFRSVCSMRNRSSLKTAASLQKYMAKSQMEGSLT